LGVHCPVFGTDGSEYTIDVEGEVSWRIEVALRAVLLAEDTEKLQKFLEGYYDGAPEQRQINDIIREILVAKVGECEGFLEGMAMSCIESDLVRRVWEAELNIARTCLELLT
jgi:hypothetical protein